MPGDYPYVCLSYCWGTNQMGRTTKENLSQHLLNISLDTLPNTVVDTLRLCWALKYRFVWVDRLCIVQDDDDDWKREVDNMCQVYSNSALTISTPICLESVESFLVKRKSDYHASHGTVQLIHKDESSMVRGQVWVHDNFNDHHNGPWFLETNWNAFSWGIRSSQTDIWHNRAWTLQEWLLSPRVLHIDTMTLWDCFEGYGNEANRRSMISPKLTRHPKGLGSPMGIEWMDIVRQFTTRHLTKAEDRLPALAGLAARYAQTTGFTYMCGLWLEELPQGLTWSYIHGPGKAAAKRPSGSSLPSWSWACYDDEVLIVPAIKHWTVASITSSSAGKPRVPGISGSAGAWIELEGPLKLITGEDYALLRTADDGPKELAYWSAYLDSYENHLSPLILDSKLYLLIISSDEGKSRFYRGLVLEKCGQIGEIDIFRRTGVAEAESQHPYSHTSWDRKRVRLV